LFWYANLTELFERGAYYAVASFIVIYLGQLGMGDYWPSTLNGILWFIVYFLPILSGTIADQIGFRKALLIALGLLIAGYAAMGLPVWAVGAQLSETVADEVTAPPLIFALVIAGILLIGLGGSVVKPCISGTVQKTAGLRATLAFAIFYMIVNIGSLTGRGASYFARTNFGLPQIFVVGTACGLLALLTVVFLYREPAPAVDVPARPRRSVGRILLDMVLVLRNPSFSLFLLVSSGFWFLYSQVYNVLPLYLKKVVETDPAVDLITMANPLTVVCFQLVVTHFWGKMSPVRSMIVGAVIIGFSMAVNMLPIFTGSIQADFLTLLPVGSAVVALNVALVAFGELFTSARSYEYIGALAPKGQEGLFLGYSNLPTAIGSLLGGPVGALIFNEVMCAGATRLDNGLLKLDPACNAAGWGILMAVGLLSAISIWFFDSWLRKQAK
jgi:dipeptide/tripeptide permease